jgi:intracellular sulfur oxidation DsrE/DsrF family protein
LVDQYGNPVAVTNALTATPASTDRGFSVTYTGPGFVIGGALPTATNAAGEFSFQVLTGAADSGSATVTVTYDLDGSYASITSTTPATSAAAISKTATVSIAAPAAPEVKTTIVGVTKAIRVRVENAKGEEVEIVVNGRTVAVATAGTNSKLWVLKSTKGKKSVKVYVDGDLVAVKTVTVK